MSTRQLSDSGQIVIPETIRTARAWKPGQELEVIDTSEGVLLRPLHLFPLKRMDEVAGCLTYEGPPVPVEAMDGAVALKRKMRSERPDDRH